MSNLKRIWERRKRKENLRQLRTSGQTPPLGKLAETAIRNTIRASINRVFGEMSSWELS